MGSTHGTFVDGTRVKYPKFLEGRHEIKLANSTITVFTKEGVLL